MSKKRILVQLDPDKHASVFDSVVAIDSGTEHLLSHGGVTEEDVTGLVHGCIFTRSVDNLKSTALFFGGSDVQKTEALVAKAKSTFFGPMRVSLMSDPNGCNTTAAAAVISASKHLDWSSSTVTILAATGPVGIRITQILASESAASNAAISIRVCSRKLERAEEVCQSIDAPDANGIDLIPLAVSDSASAVDAIAGSDAVFAAGAAGIELLADGWQDAKPKVVVDANAVPPAGIHGVEVMDKGELRGESVCYGAIGIGGLKMKIHSKCVESLFESNEKVLEVHEIHAVGKELGAT